MVLTKKDLDDAVERLIVIIDEKFSGISERITSLENSSVVHKHEIEEQNNKIKEIQDENIDLKSQLDALCQKFETFEQELSASTNTQLFNKINDIEERIEQRTNRQLRQTIIISGVRENKNETWDETRELVAETISKNLKVSFDSADKMLNRVHRANRKDPRYPNKPRRIFAALYKWNDCEELIETFRELNISGRSSVRIDYMYGPMTSLRRNLAMLKRKQLKEAGILKSAYVAFPARLLGKKPGDRKDDPYTLIEDFSNAVVQLKARNSGGELDTA